MASRSGRRGEFSPGSKDMMERSMLRVDGPEDDEGDDDATTETPPPPAAAEKGNGKRGGLQPRFRAPPPPPTTTSTATACPAVPALAPSSAAIGDAVAASPKNVASGVVPACAEEGCKVCRRDVDHPNLLLCEACNDEYHTYCLNPPLQSVPEGDFFCDKCKTIQAKKGDDGLEYLVSALPPTYTSRFGEIVWAAGGVGFGWWPACVYDPRLTVGGARQLARKNLGRRHLVYFFECNEAPFTVLGDSRLTRWDDGFAEEYDLGRVARAGGKTRYSHFERALRVAMLEQGRPIEMRMDWNHQEAAAPLPKMARQKPSGSPPSEQQPPPPQKRQKQSPAAVIKGPSSPTNLPHGSGVNRRNLEAAIRSLNDRGGANAIEPSEDGTLVCKILRRMPAGLACTTESEGIEFSRNLGFVTLPSRQSATFAAIRRAAERDLDDDAFPSDERGGRKRWKFYVPKLGPMSVKQEGKMGPALEFLKSTTDDPRLGSGTPSDPLKVVIMDV